MEIKEAQKVIHAGLAWANWTDEQKSAMKVALQAMMDLEQIEMKNRILNREKSFVHCEDCDYETGAMNYKDLIYKVCTDGGYIQSDKSGGYYSKCPECESESLSLESS